MHCVRCAFPGQHVVDHSGKVQKQRPSVPIICSLFPIRLGADHSRIFAAHSAPKLNGYVAEQPVQRAGHGHGSSNGHSLITAAGKSADETANGDRMGQRGVGKATGER